MSQRTELIFKVHANVNNYPYVPDMTVWGQREFWERISVMKQGDCEDFVLEKRFQLLELGVPLADIRIGTCFLPDGQGHAVLVVSDPEEGGDWVLDQTQAALLTLADLHGMGYKGNELQIPNSWIWERWEI